MRRRPSPSPPRSPPRRWPRRLRRQGPPRPTPAGRRSPSRPPTPRARSRARPPRRASHVQGHELGQQGQRVLRLRRGRPDRRRGREHHARADPRAQGRARRARHLPDRVQAGHGRRRHPRRLHRDRVGGGRPTSTDDKLAAAITDYKAFVATRPTSCSRTPRSSSPRSRPATSPRPRRSTPTPAHWEGIEPVAETFGDLDPKIDGREDVVAEGMAFTGYHRLEKDLWEDGLQKDSGADRRPAARRRQGDRRPRQGRRSSTRSSSPTAPRRCSTRSRPARSPARRSATRTPTSGTSTPTSRARRPAIAALRPVLEARDPALLKALDARFAELDEAARHAQGRRRLRALHRADRGRRQGADRALDALSEPVATVAGEVAGDGDRLHPPGGRSPPARVPRLAGAAAGLTYAARPGDRRGHARRRMPCDDGDRALPRRAPGRHRHPRAGPAALRGARRRDGGPRRAARPAQGLDRGRRADDAGAEAAPGGVVGGGPWTCRRTPARRSACRARPDITIGFGPSLFDDRFGLADRSPPRCGTSPPSPATTSTRRARAGTSASRPAPTTRRSRSTPCATSCGSASAWSRCAGPSSASAARRRPRRRRPRRATCSASRTARTTSRPRTPTALDEHVWVAPEDVPGAAAWMAGGSYLVARRIRMHIEVWDRTPLRSRRRSSAATRRRGRRSAEAGSSTRPTSPQGPRRPAARSRSTPTCGSPTRASSAASASCAAATTSPTAPTASATSTPGCSSSPTCATRRQFVPMQRALAKADVLNEYIEHNGSAVFACPPGVGPGDYWGRDIFS